MGALAGAVLICCVLPATDARAEVSGSVSAVSNYRYRGVSLSHNDPAVQAAVAYDDPQGWHAGAFASTVRIGQPAYDEVQGIAFAGYAQRTPIGATLEAGAVYSAFTGPKSYGYLDLLVGVTYEKISARMHYAPNYYGGGYHAIYGEADAAYRLYEHVQLAAHVGALWTNARDVYGSTLDPVFDARVGFVFDFDRINVVVSWVGISQASLGYGLTGVRSRNGLVASISWLF